MLTRCQMSLDYIRNQRQSLVEIYDVGNGPLRDGRIEDAERAVRRFSGFIATVKGAEDTKEMLKK